LPGRKSQRDGKIFLPCRKAKVTDSFAGNEVKVAAKETAGFASLPRQCLEECFATEEGGVDADDSTQDIGTRRPQPSIWRQRVDKMHGALVDASKSSQCRDVEHAEYLVDELGWQQIELAD
jgi:hypothetical protein